MSKSKRFARAGVIAGLYATMSLIAFPISSGAVQVRLSESLTLLALVYFEAVPALAVGCVLSNLITGCAPWDIVLGSCITLLSAFLTFAVGKLVKATLLKIIIGGFFPVILNATLLPLIWITCYGNLEYMYAVQFLLLFIGQGLSVYALGTPLYIQVEKFKNKKLKFLE